ncbi:MAG: DUF4347 domain-containing protein, partial [Desulfamplus sp.]|nr:DUF4347 domain-containing protein [Desulfamplus sp.]
MRSETSFKSIKQKTSSKRCNAMLLEPRILLDAAAVIGVISDLDADDTTHDSHFGSDHDFDDPSSRDHQESVQALIDAADNALPPALRADRDEKDDTENETDAAVDPHPQDSPREGISHVFIDAGIPDFENLLSGTSDNALITIINPDEQGIDVVTRTLAEYDGPVAAVHIFSHGDSGQILLGNDPITMDTLKADHGEYVSQWSGHLSPGADILIYGCSLAEGESGRLFVDKISSLTGADVAASIDPTGHHELGGNWELEYATGSIEAVNPIDAEVLGTFGYLLEDPPEATGIDDANAEADRITQEDIQLAIAGISVSGDDAASITLEVKTPDGTSTLTLGNTTLASGELGSANFSITGTVSDVNTALTTLAYTPTLNQNSSVNGFEPSITLTIADSGIDPLVIDNISVTAVNDAPDLSTQVPLTLKEGESANLSLAQLASSADALDPDIATGQQVLEQQMMVINSLPGKGTLTYQGGVVAVDQVIPVTALGHLRYTHDGTDLTADDNDSFNITVSDGGGAVTPGTIDITITPKNFAPAISGSPSLIEGQIKVVAPSINLGD